MNTDRPYVLRVTDLAELSQRDSPSPLTSRSGRRRLSRRPLGLVGGFIVGWLVRHVFPVGDLSVRWSFFSSARFVEM
jgi:hypothetical protein